MMLNLVSPPVVQPIDVAFAKEHAWLDDSADSTTEGVKLLDTLIKSATHMAETMTNRAFVQQTFELTLDCFPMGGGYCNRAIRQNPGANWLPTNSGRIELPRPPFISLDSVKYSDSSGNNVTLVDLTNQNNLIGQDICRVLSGTESPTYLTVNPGKLFPNAGNYPGAVRIRYKAGYGTTSDSVPDGIRLAIAMMVTTWYGQREMLSEKSLSVVPMTVETLLTPFVWGS